MELYQTLFELTRLLVVGETGEQTARAVLERLVEATEARRGFIVVRFGETYEQRFDVRYDPARVPAGELSFSRSLVRHVLERGEILDMHDPAGDPRFAGHESVSLMAPSAVLVVPLRDQGQIWGALYLQRPGSGEKARFSANARLTVEQIADLAGLFLRRAFEREALRERNQSLERDLLSKFKFPGIVTQDPGMHRLLRTVAQVADSGAPVLLLGESGTGKELIAQALHLNSSRAERPFVALHCAALPANMLEAELFGHTRGAFTGADRERKGRIAAADGGTLLLDEVAEIPAEVQAKLLRFLQFGEIQRVGSDRTEKVDVRVLAATHEELPALVASGRFRQDLYFRLKVIELRIPPLRARPGDIPLLTQHFLKQYWKGQGSPRWSTQGDSAIAVYAWPGNVRELEHLIQRACLLATGTELDADLSQLHEAHPVAWPVRFSALNNEELKSVRARAIEDIERAFLAALLEKHGGSVATAAREAGIQRTYLQKLLRRHRNARASA